MSGGFLVREVELAEPSVSIFRAAIVEAWSGRQQVLSERQLNKGCVKGRHLFPSALLRGMAGKGCSVSLTQLYSETGMGPGG